MGNNIGEQLDYTGADYMSTDIGAFFINDKPIEKEKTAYVIWEPEELPYERERQGFGSSNTA